MKHMTFSVPHPGYYIKEELDAREWVQRDLAFILGVSEQAVNTILTGKRGISADMAKMLGDAFDVPAEFFANLQKAYDLSVANDPSPVVAKRGRVHDHYPLREMIKRGWLEETDVDMLEVQMARFFEVPSFDRVPHLTHASKKSNYENVPPTQLAWLFRVRQIARTIDAPRFSERALRAASENMRTFLVDPEEICHAPRILAECGVRFVVVEGLPGGKIDGVCFWLNKQSPVIGVSTRLDRIDNFWFVLRHEIEHVLERHGQDSAIIDAELEGERASPKAAGPNEERVANTAATNFCVPKGEMDSFVLRKQPFFSERDILGFAKRMQVHPGIVVGQIHNRTGRYDLLRRYLVKVRQHLTPSAIVDGWGQVHPVSL